RFERCVVLLPVGGAIARFGLRGMTHRTRLPDPSLRFMQQRRFTIENQLVSVVPVQSIIGATDMRHML
ncbi:hypothetical protein, partial [Comamonas aquatilis]|uniref:hypothetical protein n=1 Tax=Comamonas aquatilis TaxID=1778406 RepID=UPI0039EF7C99